MGSLASAVEGALGIVHGGGNHGDSGAVGGSASGWWELAGHDSASLARTWLAVRAGARVASEVGLAFAGEDDDGGRVDPGTLRWYGGTKLIDGFFAGVAVRCDGSDHRGGESEESCDGLFAVLRVWDMRLLLVDRGGRAVDGLALAGRTPEEAAGWVVDRTMNILDVPVRRATLAFEVGVVDGDGGVFAEPDQLASAELLRLLSNTSVMLRRLESLFVEMGDGGEMGKVRGYPARCLPAQGFGLSAGFVVRGEDDVDADVVVEVGLSPPELDGVHDGVGGGGVGVGALVGGCWFVRSGGGGVDGVTARLGVSEVGGLDGPGRQVERLVGFLSSSIEAAAGR